MAVCTYCATTVLFGGIRTAEGLFCNERCLQSHALLGQVERVYEDVVARKVAELHQGRCPRCGGPGPNDAHRAYRVRSLLFFSTWSNTPQVCCRACARRSQLAAIGYCLALGWWGLPWGLLMTPLQVWRNLRDLCARRDPTRPSRELEVIVRVGLAAKRARERQPPQDKGIGPKEPGRQL
ncbi:MAG TPA: hypothetical protein PKM73_09120 [Verrucomicrobiota bacterium]|nr:hypothetical protein [Verrucomicrobiota bacterium]HNU51966.1 hypothetical protein [Verrucomicrobiota bacterium]